MAHGKETPRQKMIGMMYLFLTCLLALNVSAEVLNAFLLIDKSLYKTAQNFTEKNEAVYSKFFELNKLTPDKVRPYKEKADAVKVKADEMFDFLNNLKVMMVQALDGPSSPYTAENPDMSVVSKKDENNVPSQIMFLEGKGKVLKDKMVEYREFILSLVENKELGAGVIKGIENTLNTDDVKSQTGEVLHWEEAYFHHLPLAGAIAMLSKLQTDVRNAEADIINYLLGQIEAKSFKFNKLEAVVTAKSNFVLRNQPFEARVFIAASDTTITPDISVGGNPLPIKEGQGVFTGSTGTVGTFPINGEIKVKAPSTGEILVFPFTSEYQVGDPGVAISPDKMNVFYVGVENPVTISASGVPASSIRASITNGSITGSGNKWVVRVKQQGKAVVTVSAEVDGQQRTLGSMEFRVKRLPDPVPTVAASRGGSISRNELIAGLIKASMGDDFQFDLQISVVSFKLGYTSGSFNEESEGRGAKFNAKQIEIIRNMKPGQKVYIEDIRASLPDGSVRNIGSVSFKISR